MATPEAPAPEVPEATDAMNQAQTLAIRGTRLIYDGIAVGSVTDGNVTLNLGWARQAGLGVSVVGDPGDETDRKAFTKRGGLVLDRPAVP